ncbi:gamma-glutamyl-gamma-aminobutyrate hydrolase family protein [Nitrospinota bacterium]
MIRPRIGITCDLAKRKFPDKPRERDRHTLMDAYVLAVQKAGGVPLLLPSMDEEKDALACIEVLDALIISGGGHDVDPKIYGEKRRPGCGPPNSKRAGFELSICRGALSCDMPVLGICGGMQVLNVAAGGTLIQDIASEVENPLPHIPEDTEKATYTFHTVDVIASTLEATIGAGPHTVNSHHHQSVKDLGPGMRLAAKSEDGVVEAIECAPCRFVLGVQWHPESMAAYRYGDSGTSDHIFARLIAEARDYALDAGPRRFELA